MGACQDGKQAEEHDVRGGAERSGPISGKHFQGVLTADYSYLIAGYREDGARFSLEVHSVSIIGNRQSLEHGKRLDRKYFYHKSGQMLMQAAQEGVESLSLLELFKTQLDTGRQMQSCVI